MQEREAVWQEIRNRVFQNMDLSGEISDKELKRMIAEEDAAVWQSALTVLAGARNL